VPEATELFVHLKTIKGIVDELNAALKGRVFGKIFRLSSASFAIDFRRRGEYLFLSADPSLPRLYLIERPVRQLEKESTSLDEFGHALRTNLNGAILTEIERDESERVVRFSFVRHEDTGEMQQRTLVAQLTGRSANLLLLDENNRITHTHRLLNGTGQQVSEVYAPPSVQQRTESVGEPPLEQDHFSSLSAAADNYYLNLETKVSFDTHVTTLRGRLRHDLARLHKLEKHLRGDLAAHGEAEQHKRMGDLLLANISTATRRGNIVAVQDFYDAGVPTIEIEVDESVTLPAEAARYFARYSKAKRAAESVARRLEQIAEQLAALQGRQQTLEKIALDRDELALAQLLVDLSPAKKKVLAARTSRPPEKVPGTRRYVSSDGYEILVGRAAKDNVHLTFRVARPQDLWLHAADYPGSHVVVRNPTRKDLPHRTLIEAAQLAARFSQAGADSKVNVHYTQQKFVSKIKGAAPGLVRLASFKTIAVAPKESVERI
jgi:predicted ribosome quality control (RQC) complex YloA/Tae2 family protein